MDRVPNALLMFICDFMLQNNYSFWYVCESMPTTQSRTILRLLVLICTIHTYVNNEQYYIAKPIALNFTIRICLRTSGYQFKTDPSI